MEKSPDVAFPSLLGAGWGWEGVGDATDGGIRGTGPSCVPGMFPSILLCQGWGLGAENSELSPGTALREARGKMGRTIQDWRQPEAL